MHFPSLERLILAPATGSDGCDARLPTRLRET